MIASVDIIRVHFVFTDQMLNFSDDDYAEHFTNGVIVRNQIQCISKCFKDNSGSTLYYALYKLEERYCVCKRDFDWRALTLITDDTNAVKRIDIRPGKYV